MVTSAARLQSPQNRTLIERRIETEGRVGEGGSRLKSMTLRSHCRCTVKSYLTHFIRRIERGETSVLCSDSYGEKKI